MKEVVYYSVIVFIFAALIIGIDGQSGREVRVYSMILAPVWIIQTVLGNWDRFVKEVKK